MRKHGFASGTSPRCKIFAASPSYELFHKTNLASRDQKHDVVILYQDMGESGGVAVIDYLHHDASTLKGLAQDPVCNLSKLNSDSTDHITMASTSKSSSLDVDEQAKQDELVAMQLTVLDRRNKHFGNYIPAKQYRYQQQCNKAGKTNGQQATSVDVYNRTKSLQTSLPHCQSSSRETPTPENGDPAKADGAWVDVTADAAVARKQGWPRGLMDLGFLPGDRHASQRCQFRQHFNDGRGYCESGGGKNPQHLYQSSKEDIVKERKARIEHRKANKNVDMNVPTMDQSFDVKKKLQILEDNARVTQLRSKMCAKRDGTRGEVEAVDIVVVEAAANLDEIQVDVAEGRPKDRASLVETQLDIVRHLIFNRDTVDSLVSISVLVRPAVIILENVDGAPWELIKAVWENDHEPIEECFEKLNSGKDAIEQGLDAFWDDDDPHTRIPQRARTRRAQEIFERPESLKAFLYSGREVIALQGLPVDELLLTRESQRELFDLAGTTMTSTVVGEALLSAMTVAGEHQTEGHAFLDSSMSSDFHKNVTLKGDALFAEYPMDTSMHQTEGPEHAAPDSSTSTGSHKEKRS
ncbi:MAG: hypothetical protein ASARMPRED_001491 [Alectoria sarmentosa]|nr:MAG: hypothetical protein ASARMPRED_001491 [Alectoria sarmentosa]